MAKKQKFKTAKVDARVPDRLAYGLQLMSRKLGMSVSAYIGRAIEQRLVLDGIDKKEPGELHSLLDKLWAPSEAERLVSLALHAPDLMSADDQAIS